MLLLVNHNPRERESQIQFHKRRQFFIRAHNETLTTQPVIRVYDAASKRHRDARRRLLKSPVVCELIASLRSRANLRPFLSVRNIDSLDDGGGTRRLRHSQRFESRAIDRRSYIKSVMALVVG